MNDCNLKQKTNLITSFLLLQSPLLYLLNENETLSRLLNVCTCTLKVRKFKMVTKFKKFCGKRGKIMSKTKTYTYKIKVKKIYK